MARRLRYHLPGGTYHVMLRGNDGQDIFFNDEDRCRMCLLIQEGVERFGHQVHAFCLLYVQSCPFSHSSGSYRTITDYPKSFISLYQIY